MASLSFHFSLENKMGWFFFTVHAHTLLHIQWYNVRSAGHLVPPSHYIITILLPVVPLSVVAPQNGKCHLSRTIAPDERNIGIV